MDLKKIWLLAPLAMLLAGCGSSSDERIATVAGEPITKAEFDKYIQTKNTVRVRSDSGQLVEQQVAEPIPFQVLQDLIARRTLTQLAKDLNIYPTPVEVAAELEFKTKIDPNFMRSMTSRGMDMSQIKTEVALELAQERYLTRDVKVSMDEVNQYIKDNPKEFVEPAKADMRFLLVTSESSKALVDKDLGTGADFVEVATRYSEYPDARDTEARFPTTRMDNLEPTIKAVVEKTNEGTVSPWIKAKQGWIKLYVEQKTPEKPIVMDENRKKWLQRRMAMRAGARGRDLNKALAEKLRQTKVEVYPTNLKDLWKRAEQRLKNKASSGTGATAGGGG